ncbi:fasciclin-like arabinogalactan protein 12 [Euphorbia lathyris]|uniref:fasciclin-like arabinogalactan protein 12 n=1 Tax=Euphorbia lathyris TaxID=212925 RepID=UPI00331329F8
MKMNQQCLFSIPLVIILLYCTNIAAQSPASAPAAQGPAASSPPSPPAISTTPAASPAQPSSIPPPTNVTKILEKSGHFSIFIRLLRSTQEENHFLTVLNNSNNGLTIFAPTDGAFSGLKSGTLNSLTDEQKSELVKFHVIPSFLSISQFQTVTNPVGTEAGNGGRVALNFTTSPTSVSISTGLTNTSISGTVYTDNQLAIYRVDKVLLPADIFSSGKAPAPAPAVAAAAAKGPAAEKNDPKMKEPPSTATPVVSTTTASTSAAAVSLVKSNVVITTGIAIVAAAFRL